MDAPHPQHLTVPSDPTRTGDPAGAGDAAGARDRDWVDGLPAVDVLATRPMRIPPGSWGLLVTGLDTDADARTVVRFTGCWLPAPPQARGRDGDVVVCPGHSYHDPGATVGVTAWLATDGAWRLIGSWPGIGTDWPEHLAPTLLAVLVLLHDPAVPA